LSPATRSRLARGERGGLGGYCAAELEEKEGGVSRLDNLLLGVLICDEAEEATLDASWTKVATLSGAGLRIRFSTSTLGTSMVESVYLLVSSDSSGRCEGA